MGNPKGIPPERLAKVLRIKKEIKEGRYRLDPENVAEGMLRRAQEGKIRVLEPRIKEEEHPEGTVLYRRTSRKALAWKKETSEPGTQEFHDPNTGMTHFGIPLDPEKEAELTSWILERFPKKGRKNARTE